MAEEREPDHIESITAYRITLLERAVEDLRKEVDGGVAKLAAQIAGLAFVRQDVYESHRGAIRESVEGAKERADHAVRLATIGLGAIATGVLGGTILAISRVIGG